MTYEDLIKQLEKEDDISKRLIHLTSKVKNIFNYFEKALLKKDIEIAKLEGVKTAYESEIFRLHSITNKDCDCLLCTKKRKINEK